MKTRVIIFLILALILLSMVTGGLLVNALRGGSQASSGQVRVVEVEKPRQTWLDQALALTRFLFELTLRGALVAAVLSALWLGIQVAYRWLDRRASEVRPGPDGQFPLLRINVGGTVALHDPNKPIAPTVIFTKPQQADQVMVVPVVQPGYEFEQVAASARAQTVQLASAIHKHPLPDMAGGRRAAPPAAPSAAQPAGLLEPADLERLWPSRVPLTGMLGRDRASLEDLVLGVTVDAQAGRPVPVRRPMSQLIHIGVGGSSGWGKSTFLQTLAYQFVTAREPIDLVMIDLKRVTLQPFERCQRLLWPVATRPDEALAVLYALGDELARRLDLFEQVPGVMDLAGYNRRAPARGLAPLRPIVSLADECAVLLSSEERVVQILSDLTLLGRGMGLWLILANQNWKTDRTPSEIRDQLSTRVQFKALSKSQSRLLLERSDAESLQAKGRAYAILPGQPMIQLQAPVVTYDDIVAALEGQTGPQNPMPDPVPFEGRLEDGQGDVDDEQVQAILSAYEETGSMTKTQLNVFQTSGGADFYRVKAVLQQHGRV